MKYFITERLEIQGSGNTFDKIIKASINVAKYNPSKMKSYLPLPKKILRNNVVLILKMMMINVLCIVCCIISLNLKNSTRIIFLQLI
jgi:hypothetical protein